MSVIRSDEVVAYVSDHSTFPSVFTWYHPTGACLVAARLLEGAAVRATRISTGAWNNNATHCSACGEYINVRKP